MGNSKLIIFVLHLIIFTAAVAQVDLWAYECSDTYGNYTSNSTYNSNLEKLLTNISTTNIPYGFYNMSAGQDPDQVNVIALCRGDVVNVTECHNCIKLVASNLTGSCPTQMDAIGWAEKCMLKYSAGSIFGVWSNRPMYNLVTGGDAIGDVYHFTSVVEDLLSSLPNITAEGDSGLKFATGEANVSSSQMVYAMMQCTPDLIPTDCLGCLYWGLYYVLHSDNGKTGVRLLLPSCSIRYESQKFYLSSPPAATAPSSPARSGKRNRSSVVISVVVVLACLLLVMFIVCCYGRKRTKQRNVFVKLDDSLEPTCILEEPLQQDFSIIRNATNNFSDDNRLGIGGFGTVYKAEVAGNVIAVKKLERDSIAGDLEFKNEVRIAAKLQHNNLAQLLGYCICIEGVNKLLIFEFVSNGSLDQILSGKRCVEGWNKWETRFMIIKGIARGLLYLHEDSRYTVIHRDLKPGNVLLDQDLTPKITDFGTARLFPENRTHAITARPVGTLGYMAPEYVFEHKFSTKTDVYSFGVLVLEIVAGRMANVLGAKNLLMSAWENWSNQNPLGIVGTTIKAGATSSELDQMKRCIHIAMLCLQESEKERPKMSTVIHNFTMQSSTLSEPSVPAWMMNNPPLSLDAVLQTPSRSAANH